MIKIKRGLARNSSPSIEREREREREREGCALQDPKTIKLFY